VVTFKSRFEWRYAQYLVILKANGVIYDWDYEGKLGRCPKAIFYFENVKTAPVQYTPDFWIKNKDGEEYHETKGYLLGPDITKYKRLYNQYEYVKLVLVFMQKPKISVIRKGKLNRYCYRVIWNARTEIFSKIKGMIEW
jgi:hypothetical protein